MKSAALRHLMLATAEAIGFEAPERAAELGPVCASLRVRSEQGSYLLEWTDSIGADRTLRVPTDRFAFYARGDVASLLAKRADGLDLRTANWAMAMRTWAEVLGDSALAAPPDPEVVAARRDQGRHHRTAGLDAMLPLALGALCAGAAVGSTLSDRPVWGAFAFGGACSLLQVQRGTVRPLLRAVGFVATSALAAALQQRFRLDVSELRSGFLGVLACVAAARVGVGRPRVRSWVAAVAAVGLSWFAPWPLALAAAVMLALDLAAANLMAGRHSVRTRAVPIALVGVIAVGISAAVSAREGFSPGVGIHRVGWPIAVVLLFCVIGLSAFEATHGVWSQLSPHTAPAVAALATATTATTTLSTLLLASLLCALAVSASASIGQRTRAIRSDEPLEPPIGPPRNLPSPMAATPVALSARR